MHWCYWIRVRLKYYYKLKTSLKKVSSKEKRQKLLKQKAEAIVSIVKRLLGTLNQSKVGKIRVLDLIRGDNLEEIQNE